MIDHDFHVDTDIEIGSIDTIDDTDQMLCSWYEGDLDTVSSRTFGRAQIITIW